MAGPLMPQWVSSNGPDARNDVAGIITEACSTTVPISERRPWSSMLKVNNEGTGSSIS